MTPHPPQTGKVVRWRPRKLKLTVLPSFNITRDIMETYTHQLFFQIQHTQSKCLTLVPKLKYTRKYILAYLSLPSFLKSYIYCQAQSSQASVWLSGFIITWSNLTPHPAQTGIVVRWHPRQLKFAMCLHFNITRDIMETNDH